MKPTEDRRSGWYTAARPADQRQPYPKYATTEGTKIMRPPLEDVEQNGDTSTFCRGYLTALLLSRYGSISAGPALGIATDYNAPPAGTSGALIPLRRLPLRD